MARSADAVVAKVEHVAHWRATVRSTFATTASADLAMCIIPAAAGWFLRVNLTSR